MNNEPVGYYYAKACVDIRDCSEQMKRNGIPLYTHPAKKSDSTKIASEKEFWECYSKVCSENPPAKTLTDEEILQEAENMFGTYFFESIDDPYWIEFARAILRKAQEK